MPVLDAGILLLAMAVSSTAMMRRCYLLCSLLQQFGTAFAVIFFGSRNA